MWYRDTGREYGSLILDVNTRRGYMTGMGERDAEAEYRTWILDHGEKLRISDRDKGT